MVNWNRKGTIGPIDQTEMGLALSTGDMHGGTTWDGRIELPQEIIQEIKEAWRRHTAYPVVAIMGEL